MFKLSQRLFGRILPTSLDNSGDDNNTPCPPELLDRIIDHLHNDRLTLLALGLTSTQTLIRSRLHLFANLEFNHGDKQFDAFLALLDSPWTSFTYAVESLNIKGIFNRLAGDNYKYHPTRNIPRITANLQNLKTLRLTSISWPYIPRHVRDLFFQLDITNLHLDSVEFTMYQQNDVLELFMRLQPSIKSITLYNLQFNDDDIPDLSRDASIFRRQIHLETLDTTSLLLLKDVWDPQGTNDLDVTVESFHLRLPQMSRLNREAYTPFISRFLQRVGPSLHHLFIKLSDPYFDSHALTYYGSVDFSRCVNVRIIHIGTITLDQISRSRKEMSPMLSTMWTSLASLSSNSPSLLEEIVLIFRPFHEIGGTPEKKAAELESFDWLDLVGRLQDMFQSLKTVTVGVGYYVVDGEDFTPYVNALRRAPGIQQLEEKGIVSLQMIPWKTYGSPDPTWK
ncbi:hypothetical protein BYT27DRAFT_7340372 [Phlegmacium glaucopus]|nr:hypothetical protein BYT27DRAFT_7340372 [Phlegmacium glaucopus]